jgi:hypothetical protein
MPKLIPDLNLSLGQVLSAIRYSSVPNEYLKNQVRYLRALGIPQASGKHTSGTGNRVRYGFDDLIEVGLAVTALDLGFRPKDIAGGLVSQRDQIREAYRLAWTEVPEKEIEAPWVRSRGHIKPMFGDELYIRLHDRRSDKWGKIDFVSAEEADETLDVLEPIERFADGPPRRLIPLKRLMVQWVAAAMDVPEIRPGRR